MSEREFRALGRGLLALALWGGVAFAQSPASLENGGFERQVAGLPSGWSSTPEQRGKGRVLLEQGAGRGGSVGLRLRPNSTNKPGPSFLGLGQRIPAAAWRGKRVRLSAWLGAEGGAVAIVGLSALPKGKPPAAVQIYQASKGGRLAPKSSELKIPRDAKWLIVYAIATGTQGTATFDDVRLEVLGASTPAAAGKGKGVSAKVRVFAGDTIRTIPREIYGSNTGWTMSGNGVWVPGSHSLNEGVVELTRGARPSLLRFPGGTLGDHYDWRKGVGPRERRPRVVPMPGNTPEVPHFGTDEALEFARRVGARLLIVVNAGTGTPEQAAAWVRHVNLVKAKQEPRYRVEFWEIGNEVYHKPGGDKGGMTLGPKAYARKFLRIARAMRKVDPTIKVGAVGLENYGRYRFNSYPGWNETVLRLAGREMDFFAQHNAYAPVGVPDSLPFEDGYRSLLAAPAAIRQNLERVTQQIKDFAPRRKAPIELAVTEWGTLFHAFVQRRWTDHSKTLGAALFTASMLKLFVEHPRVRIANQFKLTDLVFMGLLGVARGTRPNSKGSYVFRPTAPYYAFQLFTRHFGSELVRSSVTVPTFRSKDVGWHSATQAPLLEVVASKNAGGDLLYVLAINKSFDQPVRARFEIAGFDPQAKGVTWTLTGAGLGANTGTGPLQARKIKYADSVVAPRDPQHAKGHPDAVKLVKADRAGLSARMEFVFPARSITSIRLRRR
jgi:alpha-N-arabinofuranosidase